MNFQVTKDPWPIFAPRNWDVSSFRVLIRIAEASSHGKGTWRVTFAINAARSPGLSVPTATTCAKSRLTYGNTFGPSIRTMMSMLSIFFSNGKSSSEFPSIFSDTKYKDNTGCLNICTKCDHVASREFSIVLNKICYERNVLFLKLRS